MLHSPEFYKKKVKVRNIKIGIGIFAVLIIIVLPIVVLRLERFQLRGVEAHGNTVTQGSEIEKVVKQELMGNYAWVIPRTNAFLYPQDGVREALHREIPRLVEVRLDRTSFQTLAVKVKERAPYALYCEQLQDTDGSGCYFLDDDGLVFSKAPYFSGDVYFIYTLDVPQSEPLGKTIIDSGEFGKLRDLVAGLEDVGFESRYLVVGDKYELTLRDGGKIIWKKDEDTKLILNNLTAFLKSPTIVAEKDFLKRVSSIDLSIPNKVIYKFRSE